MQFATLDFALFFAFVASVSWALRGWRMGQKLFLILASAYFYSQWDWKLLGLITGSAVGNWLLGELLVRSEKEGGRKGWMIVGVVANLLLLGTFKYYNFFRGALEPVLAPLGLDVYLPIVEILLPMGISYYSIQSITYVVDLYRGYGVRAESLVDYVLFITFFPQVLLGPICRSRDLLPQIQAPAPKLAPDVALAATLIFSGLFKKVVMATYLSTALVDDAFRAPDNYSSMELMVAAYGYTIQIYCDFSGYVDIARGLGLLMGVSIPDNFNAPYRATSVAEFWRRWHMTFSNCMRDYVYLPLGGSRKSKPRVYLNLMLTMLIAGLWHGAHVRFLAWAFIHGAALVGYKMVQDWRRSRGQSRKDTAFPLWYLALGWLFTMHWVTLARIFFKSADLEVAGIFLRQLATFSFDTSDLAWPMLPIILLGFAIHFVGGQIRAFFVEAQERLPKPLWPVVWAVAGVVLFALQPDTVPPYIYGAF